VKRIAFFSGGDFVVNVPFPTYEECNEHCQGRHSLPYEAVAGKAGGTGFTFSLCYFYRPE
jgi:hypothetical protein